MPLYLQLTTVSYLRSLGDNMLHCHLHCIQIWHFTYYMLSLRPVGQTKFVLVFFSKKLTGARALHSAQCYTRKPYWPKSETESITPSVYHTRALSGLLSASVVCVCVRFIVCVCNCRPYLQFLKCNTGNVVSSYNERVPLLQAQTGTFGTVELCCKRAFAPAAFVFHTTISSLKWAISRDLKVGNAFYHQGLFVLSSKFFCFTLVTTYSQGMCN